MSRFIDVVTAAATTRRIESYESALWIEVNSGRRISCIDASLALRDKVIQALKSAGFDDSQINEGGSNIRQHQHSSSKFVSHRILVRSSDMSTLIRGMAALERTLDSNKPSYFRALFASIKESFTFDSPRPLYAPSASAAEALEHAMQRARATADAIAQAHGETVDSVIHVYELGAAAQSQSQGHDELEVGADDIDSYECISGGSTSYSPLEQPTGRGTRRFRVRFLLKSARE